MTRIDTEVDGISRRSPNGRTDKRTPSVYRANEKCVCKLGKKCRFFNGREARTSARGELRNHFEHLRLFAGSASRSLLSFASSPSVRPSLSSLFGRRSCFVRPAFRKFPLVSEVSRARFRPFLKYDRRRRRRRRFSSPSAVRPLWKECLRVVFAYQLVLSSHICLYISPLSFPIRSAFFVWPRDARTEQASQWKKKRSSREVSE